MILADIPHLFLFSFYGVCFMSEKILSSKPGSNIPFIRSIASTLTDDGDG
jgi:hypothetical protein